MAHTHPTTPARLGDPANLTKPSERTCPECGRAFYGLKRAKFCSDACKQRAYRRRRDRPQHTL